MEEHPVMARGEAQREGKVGRFRSEICGVVKGGGPHRSGLARCISLPAPEGEMCVGYNYVIGMCVILDLRRGQLFRK